MKKIRLITSIIFCVLALTCAFCACTQETEKYMDGTFVGKSATHDPDSNGLEGGYCVVRIEIKDNVFLSCELTFCEADGTIKDGRYAYNLSPSLYDKAQKALIAGQSYAQNFVKHNGLKGWDPSKDALAEYDQFVEAVNSALGQAKIIES